MKKLFSIIILCLGCFGFLEAQDNIWKPIDIPGTLMGVSSDGSIFAYSDYFTYVEIVCSQDEGETWQVVLSSEPNPDVRFLENGFAISEEGRIFVLGEHQEDNFDFCLFYSDDNGDTWQQTSEIPYFLVSGLVGFGGITAPANDIIVCWSSGGDFIWSIDGGETWNYTSFTPPHDGIPGHLPHELLDVIVNESGELYATYWLYCNTQAATARTNIYEMSSPTSWQGQEIFSCTVINDMEYDPEGNALMGYVRKSDWTGYDMEYYQGDRYYVFEGQSIAVSDNGVVYKLRYTNDLHAVLNYSLDHGEHFYDVGEALSVAQSSSDLFHNGSIFKGSDNYLYFYGGTGQYYKSIYNADEIISQHRPFAPLGAEWYFHVLSQGPITEPPFYYIRHAVTGVAEVQGHLCSVIDDSKYVYEEDNVVYMYNFSTDAFTVMYDFNAEEGDTWYCDIEEGYTCLVTVESVGSVTWNGLTYRTQYVTGYIPDEGFLIYDGRIIEGIGYEKGLFPHEYVFDGTEYDYMRCYLEDGELLYHEGSYDCDYVPGNNPPVPLPEWYYEIEIEDGTITYQYLYQAGDTVVQDEPAHILVKINTLYDKGVHADVTHEYVYERDGKLYWWNKTLGVFTVLYDYEAEVGDEWEIKVGTESLTMHVDAVETVEYEDKTYRMLHVSDVDDYFSGDIVCGIGHLTSFFPERLMDKGDGLRVEGLRCYWIDDALVFKLGDEDCDAIYSEVHGVEEITENQFDVYPNPVNGVLFVRTHAVRPYEEYRITNLMGQTVLSGNITAETQQIDVLGLPMGMYFVTVGGETRKFVVR